MSPLSLSRAPFSNARWLFVSCVIAILLLSKTPDALQTPQFWAEDGLIFFQQQYGHALPQVFTTYAGYLHTTMRLVSWFAAAFPYKDAPLIYNLATLFIDTASITYFARKAHFLASFWIIVAIFVLVPTNGEEFGALANTQWFLQFVLFAAVFFPAGATPITRGRYILASATLFIVALTGPFSILCAIIGVVAFALFAIGKYSHLPALQTWGPMDWWRRVNKPYLGIVAFGGAVQLIALDFFGHRQTSGRFSLGIAESLLATGMQKHLTGMILVQSKLLIIAAIVVAIVTIFHSTWQIGFKVTTLVAMALFSMLQIAGVSSEASHVLVNAATMDGDRYYFFAKITFWLAVATLLNVEDAPRRYGQETLVPIVLLLLAFYTPGLLQRASLIDLHWKQESLQFQSASPTVIIPVNPVPAHLTLHKIATSSKSL